MRTLALLLALLLVGSCASAQVTLDRQTTFSSKSYTTSQKDTSSSYRLAGARSLDLVTFTEDTMACDTYVDYSDDLTTWTVILTDSVKSTNTTAKVTVHSIKDGDSDLIDKCYGWLRVRNAQRATGTAVVGTYTQRFYFRP
jgi:PBP1b-binding outer membrane lipoprotein LpoB